MRESITTHNDPSATAHNRLGNTRRVRTGA
jgi:hypothetical protein